MLCDTNTSHLFPLLVNDISYGSLIGNPPPLRPTFILVNLSSALKLPHNIDDEIISELAAKRMSGPFTVTQVKYIFKGHFRTSPLGLIEEDPGSGKWRTI